MIPEAIDLGAILVLILAFIVSLGFLYAYRATMKPLLLGIADLMDKVVVPIPRHHVHILGDLAAWVRSAALTIDHALGALVLDTEKGVVILWRGLTKQVEWLGKLLAELAETIEARLRALALGTIPHQLGQLRRALTRQLAALAAAVAAAETAAEVELARLRRGIDRTAKRIEGAIAGGLAALRERVGNLERAARGELARVRHLEGKLTAIGAAALVGAALARLGLGWVRCPRVAKVGKQACGMDYGLLESLLADTLIIAGTISLVEFTREMQAVTGEIAGPIRAFWRAA